MAPRSHRAAFGTLFFVSGALALVYQVLWQRQFALLFGSGSAATAVVLAAFFAGLGSGSAAIGRAAPRWKRPLRAYAILELLIALGALAVTPVLSGFGHLYPGLAARFADSPGVFVALKGLLAFLSIALPTACMGGTLPVLAQSLDQGPRRLGLSVGGFYVANTAGAALGCLSVPFGLLPALGMNGTLRLCAAANVAVALAAWWLDGRATTTDPAPPPATAPPRPAGGKASPAAAGLPTGSAALLGLSAVSGGVIFALQVLWNRAFAQIHENSLHAFAVIAAVFILALAAGGQLARIALRRQGSPERLLGFAWLAGGVGSCAAPWLFTSLTGLAFLPGDGGWLSEAGRLLSLGFLLVLPPVLLLGMGFPALLEAAGRASGAEAGVLVGRLLGINIAGCVAGALLAGFVLPPILGLWGSLIVAGGTAVLAGAMLVVPPGIHRRRSRRTVSGIVLAALIPTLLASSSVPRVRLAARQNERLLALTEGSHGIVAVTERLGSRRLKLNNHYALGGTLSLGDQRMQSHLPLLLHPAPRRVGHLGLGTGLSAGGILFHPVSELEVVELVPEVRQAARAHFAEDAAGLHTDPRVRIRIEDARNFLRSRPEPFDVLIGDLVVPWRQGEGALFTLEHFTAARSALRPGGLFCQWLPMFQLSETETRILLRTFLTVFPRAYLWRGDFSPDQPALALIGATDSFHPDPATVRRGLAAMRPDPANPQLADPAGLWMNFVGILEPGDLDPGETRLHSEDHPWIELLGPRTHVLQGRSRLFTGRGLQLWLSSIRRGSDSRVPFLGPPEREAAAAGDLLFDFSLALRERNEVEATRLRRQLERQLPPAVVRAIFGGQGP